MRTDTHPFMKTCGRGSAYCTRGGAHWILKRGSSWHLFRMGRPADGIAQETLGRFPTLGAAVTYYKEGNR
jgi:hypothetical protein